MKGFIGLPDKEEHLKRDHVRRVSKAMRKWHAKKHRRRARKARHRARVRERLGSWSEYVWPGEIGKFEHSRNENKRRYRWYLQLWAYKLHGLVPPVRGTGHKQKHWGEYEALINLVAFGYDPTKGEYREELNDHFRKGRWELEYPEWKEITQQVSPDQRPNYRVKRKDTNKEFSKENCYMQLIPGRTRNQALSK